MNETTPEGQVSIRELQRNAAAVFHRVEHGETVAVTRHGRTVARILPPDPAEQALARAAEAGILDLEALAKAPTAARLAKAPRVPQKAGERPLSKALEELRDAEGER